MVYGNNLKLKTFIMALLAYRTYKFRDIYTLKSFLYMYKSFIHENKYTLDLHLDHTPREILNEKL